MLSDEDAIAAAECIDFVDQRRAVLQEAADKAAETGAEISEAAGQPMDRSVFLIEELKETYLEVDDLEFPATAAYPAHRATTAGYVDHVLLNHDKTYAEMLDWKFGMWLVEAAENNVQGISYALGLFRRYPTLQKIKFFFKQPHLDHVSDAIFTREQVPALYLRIQTIAARARAAAARGDFSTAKPHVPVCNFCGNIATCPLMLTFALRVSKKFDPLNFPDEITPTMVMSAEQTGLCMRLSQVMKVWSEAFRRQVTDRIMRGDADMLENYKLETRQGRREVVDMALFKQVSLRFMTEEQYQTCLSASFGPLEDIITETAPRGQKTVRVKEFADALAESGAVQRKPGYSFLMPINKK